MYQFMIGPQPKISGRYRQKDASKAQQINAKNQQLTHYRLFN